eukprot:13804218-Heterocapsa_arctica.AAC.1
MLLDGAPRSSAARPSRRRPVRCTRCRSPSCIPTCRRPRLFLEAADSVSPPGGVIHAALFHVEDEPPFDLAEPLAHD